MPTTTETRVNDLIINKMSKAQFDALQEKSPTELYIVEGDSNAIYAEQITALPTAAAGNLGRLYQYIGATDANYTQNYFYKCVSSGSPAVYSWQQVNVQPAGDNFQYDVMPAASAANKDHIIQYIGQTTADYQNGYFYKSMSGGACTVTEYISLYEDQPSVMPTFTFERDVFDKYLEDNELAPNTGSSIRAELYTDEEEGDTYYKIIYNINNTDDEFILDIENNYIEDVVEVNKGFKKVGIISTFCESDMDVWNTQLFESITMTLPNTSSYFWLQIDTQPIKDTLPPRMNNFTENSFLVTDYDNNLMWNNCQDKILPYIDNNCRLLTSMGNRPKWSDICIKSNIQDRTICLSNDQNLADERIYTGFHNSIVIGARTVNGGGQPTNANNLVAVGQDAFAYDNAVAVGYNAGATTNAIQLGTTGSSSVKTVNNDQNTFKVANANGNFEMMSSDGTIPEARLADTTNAQQGDVLTLDANGDAVWATPSSGGGVPTLTWYTISTAGNTLTIADTSSAQLVKIYKNGLLLQPTEDYTISGTTLTTVSAMVVGDKITTEVF